MTVQRKRKLLKPLAPKSFRKAETWFGFCLILTLAGIGGWQYWLKTQEQEFNAVFKVITDERIDLCAPENHKIPQEKKISQLQALKTSLDKFVTIETLPIKIKSKVPKEMMLIEGKIKELQNAIAKAKEEAQEKLATAQAREKVEEERAKVAAAMEEIKQQNEPPKPYETLEAEEKEEFLTKTARGITQGITDFFHIAHKIEEEISPLRSNYWADLETLKKLIVNLSADQEEIQKLEEASQKKIQELEKASQKKIQELEKASQEEIQELVKEKDTFKKKSSEQKDQTLNQLQTHLTMIFESQKDPKATIKALEEAKHNETINQEILTNFMAGMQERDHSKNEIINDLYQVYDSRNLKAKAIAAAKSKHGPNFNEAHLMYINMFCPDAGLATDHISQNKIERFQQLMQENMAKIDQQIQDCRNQIENSTQNQINQIKAIERMFANTTDSALRKIFQKIEYLNHQQQEEKDSQQLILQAHQQLEKQLILITANEATVSASQEEIQELEEASKKKIKELEEASQKKIKELEEASQGDKEVIQDEFQRQIFLVQAKLAWQTKTQQALIKLYQDSKNKYALIKPFQNPPLQLLTYSEQIKSLKEAKKKLEEKTKEANVIQQKIAEINNILWEQPALTYAERIQQAHQKKEDLKTFYAVSQKENNKQVNSNPHKITT